MTKISVESDNECYLVRFQKSELEKIPDFNKKEIYSSFSSSGLVLTGLEIDKDEDLELVSQIIDANKKSLKELID